MSNKKNTIIIVVAVIASLLAITIGIVYLIYTAVNAAIPVPDDKQAYIGTWIGEGTTFSLTRDGGIAYITLSGKGRYSFNGPLREISDQQLVAGLWFVKNTFTINEPPHQEDGEWYMTLNGKPLVKQVFISQPKE